MILRYVVTVAVAVAAGVPLAAAAAPPDAARAARAPAAPSLRDFDLREGADRSAPIRALDRHLRRSGVDALIRSSGQKRLGRGCGRAARVPAGTKVYCFDRADTATKKWLPQGVTSVSDAVENERWAGGGRPMVVSWHNNGKVRITFVNPAKRTYRHVLLVEPVMKGRHATYRDIDIHAGGITWYGNKLYVADTRRGLRVFDMRQIYDLARSRAGSTRHPGRVGRHGNRYYGHGHRYVMPQTGSRLFARGGAGARCRGTGPIRMSWLSLDRTTRPHSLIAGEYCRPHWPRGRVVTWPLREFEGGGTARANWAAGLPGDRIQGGVRTRGHWWFTHYRGMKPGRLLITSRAGGKWSRVRRRTISIGPEDLACHRGRHRIWTLAEHPRRRALWGFPADSCA